VEIMDENRMHASGEDGQYRYSEIVSRDGVDNRFDVPVTWLGEEDEDMMSYSTRQCEAIKNFHNAIDNVAAPIALSLWNIHEKKLERAAAGFLVNDPGAQNQEYHRDGPKPGFLDAFVLLIDLHREIGPTSLLPRTHFEENTQECIAEPLLKKGELLIFDYRTLHRGQGNTSTSTRRYR